MGKLLFCLTLQGEEGNAGTGRQGSGHVNKRQRDWCDVYGMAARKVKRRVHGDTVESRRRVCIAFEALIPESRTEAPKKKAVVDKQFAGDCSAASWNVQGLLASEASRQHAMMGKARGIFAAHGILGLRDTQKASSQL